MLFLVSSLIIFWLYAFLIPTPRLYISSDASIQNGVSDSESNVVIKEALKIAKIENKGKYYYFDLKLESKRNSAIFLHSMLTLISILLVFLLFHKKTHIFFPLITSVLVAYVSNIVLWIFTNTIDKSIYLDIQGFRSSYFNLRYIQLISIFLFLEFLVLLFGTWYRFPKR
jgi:hypothetical protein